MAAVTDAAPSGRRPLTGSRDAAGLTHVAGLGLYYAMAVVFLWLGAMKFTAYEAAAIAPLVMNSPFVSWWLALFGIDGASRIIGMYEVVTGLLLAARIFSPRMASAGAVLSIVTFLITLSFFFTTPTVPEPRAGGFPAISVLPGQFLLKDLVLLTVSFYMLFEALAAHRARRA